MAIYGNMSLFEESVSAVTSTNSVEIGTRRVVGSREYLYVYNKSTSTATTKYGVVYSASSGYSVTISSVGGEMPAGVVYNADIGPTQYGWIVVQGFAPLQVQTNGPGPEAFSDGVLLGANGAFYARTAACTLTGVRVATPTAFTASAGTFNAFVHCE
jgi:hypothetical protein